MAGWADDLVELSGELWMRRQVFPERQAEDLGVGWSARAHILEHAAPGVSEAPADAFQVEAEAHSRVQQPAGGFVQREAPRLGLLEDALGNQLFEDAVEHVGIAAGRGSEGPDAVRAR